MRDIRRWAVYFAPKAESALARFGADWLGWDAQAGVAREGFDLEGLPRSRVALTETPRRYGFHATLKAPFPLAAGCEPGALNDAIAAIALDFPPFDLTPRLAILGSFVALVAEEPVPELDALAAACVTRLDPFRGEAPSRDVADLSPGQIAHLARWGYPFVLDQFQFHMTLTGPLGQMERDAVRAVLEAATRPILETPLQVSDICLFGETADGNFHILNRFPLTGRREPLS